LPKAVTARIANGFLAPVSVLLEGTMVVYAEDGVTPLGSSLVTLTSGKAYALILK
jgi:hypothetical protein